MFNSVLFDVSIAGLVRVVIATIVLIALGEMEQYKITRIVAFPTLIVLGSIALSTYPQTKQLASNFAEVAFLVSLAYFVARVVGDIWRSRHSMEEIAHAAVAFYGGSARRGFGTVDQRVTLDPFRPRRAST